MCKSPSPKPLSKRIVGLVSGLVLSAAGAVPLAAIDESPYGLNIHAPQGVEIARRLDKVQASGVKWVRIDFVWAWVEPAQDQFVWQPYDELVAAARARGLWVFATLAYSPAWATDGRPMIGVPRRVEDWTDICVRAAQRYRDSIEVWGLWNEPNLDHFWAGSRQQYLDVILRPGAAAIRSANTEAKIAGPDLAHLAGDGRDWFTWLKDVLERAGDSIDIVTHHLYDRDGPRDVTDKLDRSTQFGSTPALWPLFNPSVREVLTKVGWFGRPFWLTETGWVADSGASESAQASHVSGFLNEWFTQRPGHEWIDKVFLYELADDPTPSVPKWGLLRSDLSEKPAFRSVRNIALGIVPGGNGAAIVGHTIPREVRAGSSFNVTITMKNLGSTTWSRRDGYKLGAVGDADPFSPPRRLIGRVATVGPEQSWTFRFKMVAPTAPGNYLTDWQMLREGVERFGPALTVPVRVLPAAP